MIPPVARFTPIASILLLVSDSGTLWARDQYQAVREQMVEDFVVAEGVKDSRVLDSLRRTPRHEFVPAEQKHRAYWDMALAIGHAQTISPPYIVAYMTEQLDPQREDKVLEIGTGSGYQAAVLAPIVKEVYTIEIVEPLGKRAAAVLKKLKYDNVHVRVGDGFKGWPEKAPFDKIIVTCSPEDVPKPLVEQLKEGGRMIIPLGERYQQTLYMFTKTDGKLVREALAPTMFVPMTGQAEANRKVKPDPANPKLINGGFEDLEQKSGRPANWYYQRQLEVKTDGAPEGKRFVTFANREAARLAQALQAFPVDGREVKQLAVACRVKGDNLRAGPARDAVASIVITFYDKDRKVLDDVILGDWRGTFDWQTFSQRIKVPPSAREAIFRIGLQGGTGTLSFDQTSVEAVK
jgi:protein-L-isoaspartate(D-aspartate) O-methyltransferase